MKPNCPHCCPNECLETKLVIRKGYFFRACDSRHVARFRCTECGRHFSRSTLSPKFRQHKRRENTPLFNLLTSGVSMRRSSTLLRINRKTVARKKRFLATQARVELMGQIQKLYPNGARSTDVQFDDMESFHHTKLKPLSIPLVVENHTRLILGFGVCSMPAKGFNAVKSIKKYGKRPDDRAQMWLKLLKRLKPYIDHQANFHSDKNPIYPSALRAHFPAAKHTRSKSRRACVVGQGELKSGGFDPLFSLNHTAAMLRANINRLFRKTWCTTKKPDALYDHISLYAARHNRHIMRELGLT